MEFIVSNNEYVTITDGTSREILLDEIYTLTNSRKLVEFLIKNVNEIFILFRTRSKYDSHKRLILMHSSFKKGSYYFNIKTGKRYKCLGYDKYSNSAILRLQTGHKKKLCYTTNVYDWAIIK